MTLHLKELCWTTRAEICEKLLHFARETSPTPLAGTPARCGEESVHRRAIELFATLADDSFVPALRHLLEDEREEQPARMAARKALVRLKAELPAEELTALLQDKTLGEHPVHFYDIADLLELFHSQDAQRTARTVLESWSAEERARLLDRLGLSNPPKELVDWLFNRWLNEDRRLVEHVQEDDEPLNCSIASRFRERAEAKRILLDYWRRAEGEWREELRDRLWDFDEGVPAEWVAGSPEEMKELAENFKLTHAGLVDYFGTEPLLHLIEQKLRGVSRLRRADPDDYSPVHTQEFLRIVGLMAYWPEPGVRERVRSLFCCPDIEKEVRWEFCYYLWEGHREEVVALALAAGSQAGDFELPARVLRWLVDDPHPEDRELLQWSARQDENWQLPYWAVQGLERLGEDCGEWRQRLEALARSEDPFLRLQAAGALARRGDEERLAEIVREAAGAEDACVRGEAIRVLGDIGAVQHLDVIERALWANDPVFVVCDDDSEEPCEQQFLPAAEEAALALARLGTPEALTALMQAYLFLPPDWARCQAGYHLETLVARLDGKAEPFDTMPWTGWRQERFGRLP